MILGYSTNCNVGLRLDVKDQFLSMFAIKVTVELDLPCTILCYDLLCDGDQFQIDCNLYYYTITKMNHVTVSS